VSARADVRFGPASRRVLTLATLLATVMVLLVLAAPGSAATVPYFQALPASGSTQLTVVRWRGEAAGLPDGRALFVGGFAPGVTNSAETFDPSSADFAALPASTLVARADAVIAPLPNGQLLIAGGFIPGGGWQRSAEIYNPLAGTFTALPATGNTELQVARAGAISAPTINGDVLIAGGNDNNTILSSAEVFHSSNDTFTSLGATMTVPRYGAVASELPGGSVLIAGGSNGTTVTQSAEVYNAAFATFTALTPSGDTELQTPRQLATATTLPSGKILIAGGQSTEASPPSGTALSSVEEFDPSSGTFASVPAAGATELQTAREGAAAAPISGGAIIAGGDSQSGAVLSSAERVTEVSQPTCSSVPATTPAGGAPTSIRLACTVSGPAPNTEALLSSPSHGTVGAIDARTGTVTYTPTKGFTGADSFAYEATNVAGASNVAVVTVTVPPIVFVPTIVRTVSATAVGQTGAVLRGSVTPGTGTTSAQFEYGTHRTLSRATATKLQSVPSGVGTVPISARLSGLTPRTTYYYRIRALNSTTGATVSGPVLKFTTTRPFGRVVATMLWTFDPHGRYVTVSELVVNDAPVGGRIVIGCHGRGCPRARTLSINAPKVRCKVRHGKRSCAKPVSQVTEHLTTLFAHVRLADGAKLVVRIIKTSDVGKVFAFTIRRGGVAPTISCLAPGSTKPEGC
jgi:Big-like domain-containing protein/Kelch motif protein/galactose oxidase-like protein